VRSRGETLPRPSKNGVEGAARWPHNIAVTSPPPSSPTVREVARPTQDADLDALYQLILLDDDDHSYPYVIEMLGKVFGYGKEKAFALACLVDSEGRVTLETASHDQVTRHQSQIHGYGADPRIERCHGSMSAIVERVP
jgi:ATP-dependent Clp protease adaptor protein ClpS